MSRRSRHQGVNAVHGVLVFFAVILLLLLVAPNLGLSRPAQAASDYEYTILKEECTIHVNTNGGAHIEYLISIQNQGAYIRGLDFIMPNLRYDLDTAQAAVSGEILSNSDIKESSRFEHGVYVDFGKYPIPSKGLGTVWLKVWDPVMTFENDAGDSEMKIAPTWFPEDENILTKELIVTFKVPLEVHAASIYALGEEDYHSRESDGTNTNVQWRFEDIYWSRENVRRSFGITAPSSQIEPHSEFWEISFYEFLAFFTPFNIAILLGILVLLVVAVFMLTKAMGKRTPYKNPTFSADISRVDHTLDPASFAFLDGRRPQRILAILLLLSIKEGVVNVISKDPVKIEQGSKRSSVLNNPYAKLKDGKLDENRVKEYFQSLQKDLDEKAHDLDLDATRSHFANKIAHSFSRLDATKGPLDELKTIDSDVCWMVLDKSMKKKWGDFLEDHEEVTVPEWLFLLLYDDMEYTAMRFKPRTKDEKFLEYIKDRVGSVFTQSGVTVDGEDTDELLIETIYEFEEHIPPKIRSYLQTIRKYKAQKIGKQPGGVRGLPKANRGTYVKYGGGL